MVFQTLSSSIISLDSQYKIMSEAEFTDEGTDTADMKGCSRDQTTSGAETFFLLQL